MTDKPTDYGRLIVGTKEELFANAVSLAADAYKKAKGSFTWALTGGSTPLEWYRWVVANRAFSMQQISSTHFTVSDERHVPETSEQSNFGHAKRLLFDPLGVPAEHRHAWPTHLEPAQAAAEYSRTWASIGGAYSAYDVCFLGMGDDAHTASFFPGSPLLSDDGGKDFAAVDAGQKGWRLTVTPTGLRHCGLIVVMTLGAQKAPALRRVFRDEYSPVSTPSQILKSCASRVVWLVDSAAASDL
jgi:6-phosphogluconolactonase